MKLRFEIGLDDIGIGLDMMSNSQEEREEFLDFITDLDGQMADADFTHDLVYRLAVSLAEDSEARGWEPVALPEARATTFGQLYEALSYMDEDKLIALMANAMMVKRDRDKEAAANGALCGICGHPAGVHNFPCDILTKNENSCHACSEQAEDKAKLMSLSTVCVCGHNLNWHEESHGPDKGCMADPASSVSCECAAFRPEAETDSDIELTPGGTVTDCVGGPCGCKEGAHE